MALTLKLNRGASYTTINLNDGTNYCTLDTFLPRIATRRVSQFGGNPYNDVVENIPVRVKGTTAAAVLEKLEDIIAALEQAYAWKLGAIVDPVLLEYLPNGSSLGAVVQAAVLGSPSEASDLLALGQYAMKRIAGGGHETDLDIPLWRRGLWLGTSETPTPSSAVANPGAMSVTFATSLRLPSPVKLVLGDAGSYTAFGGTHSGFILTADVADKITQIQAPTNSPSVGAWSTITDASASGGSVQRLTIASGSVADGSTNFTINANARFFAIFASVFNASTTFEYLLKVKLGASGYTSAYTRPIVLPVSAGSIPNHYPRLVFLGYVSMPVSPTVLYIHADGNGATGAGNEFEFDYFVVAAVDENTQAISFSNELNQTFRRMSDTTVDHQLLTLPQPRFTYFIPSVNVDFAFRQGDLYLNSVGNNLTAWVLGTDRVNQAYRLQNGAGVISFTLAPTRHHGYLVVR